MYKRYLPIDKITLIHYYLLPDLRIEQDSIKYYEETFGQKIHQYPHPRLYRLLNDAIYQSYWTWEYIVSDFGLPRISYDKMYQLVKKDLKMTTQPQCMGLRRSDTIARAMLMKKKNGYDEENNKLYPIYDWTPTRLYDEIKQSGYKLPDDYRLFGRSFDGLQYEFIEPLKRYYPDDYKKIEEMFPNIGVEIFRRGL